MRFFRKILTTFLAFLLLASGAYSDGKFKKYTHTFFDTFDTVVILIGYSENIENFNRHAKVVEEKFRHYHKIFDAYNGYENINNLYFLNQNAYNAPVKVEKELFELIEYCKNVQPFLQNTVNIALGSVLTLWHNARDISSSHPENAYIPSKKILESASVHTNMDDVVLNDENKTIHFLDQNLKINLGSIAKGYTAELVAKYLESTEMTSFIINAGGNVRTGKKPLDGRNAWGVIVQNPSEAIRGNQNAAIETLFLQNLSVVTSGDYQRFFTFENKNYHHLISPQTLYPASHMRSVTIVTKDSGLADLLSTTLFLMDYKTGKNFISLFKNVGVIWVLNDGSIEYTENIKHICRSFGADSKTIANLED